MTFNFNDNFPLAVAEFVPSEGKNLSRTEGAKKNSIVATM